MIGEQMHQEVFLFLLHWLVVKTTLVTSPLVHGFFHALFCDTLFCDKLQDQHSMHLTDIACARVGKRSVKPFVKWFDRVKDLGEEEIQQSPKFGKGVQQRSSGKNEARNQAEVASCCWVHLAVLGAGKSSSMSSSSLLISALLILPIHVVCLFVLVVCLVLLAVHLVILIICLVLLVFAWSSSSFAWSSSSFTFIFLTPLSNEVALPTSLWRGEGRVPLQSVLHILGHWWLMMVKTWLERMIRAYIIFDDKGCGSRTFVIQIGMLELGFTLLKEWLFKTYFCYRQGRELGWSGGIPYASGWLMLQTNPNLSNFDSLGH